MLEDRKYWNSTIAGYTRSHGSRGLLTAVRCIQYYTNMSISENYNKVKLRFHTLFTDDDE